MMETTVPLTDLRRASALVRRGSGVAQHALTRAVTDVTRALMLALELRLAGLERARDGARHVVTAVFAGGIAAGHVEQQWCVGDDDVTDVAGLGHRYIALRLL